MTRNQDSPTSGCKTYGITPWCSLAISRNWQGLPYHALKNKADISASCRGTGTADAHDLQEVPAQDAVVALREIADETINLDGLRESLVKGLQRQVEVDEPEEEILEVMADEAALAQAMMAGAAQAAEAAEDEVEIPDGEVGADDSDDRA